MSANKPNSRENHTKGTSSGSSDPSDEDDEAGACEQSTNPVDVKRLRRYVKLKHSEIGHNNSLLIDGFSSSLRLSLNDISWFQEGI